MGFKIKSYNAEDAEPAFELVKKGKYEATVTSIETQEYNGNWNLSVGVEIRSDFKQEHQGAKILYNSIYLEPEKSNYPETTQRKLNAFLKAINYQGKPNDIDTDDVERQALNKNVLIDVGHFKKDDKTYARVNWFSESKISPATPTTNINVGEDDLPF